MLYWVTMDTLDMSRLRMKHRDTFEMIWPRH